MSSIRVSKQEDGVTVLVKWLLAWGIFYVVSFGILVALGLWTLQDLVDFFFRSPKIEDHFFAIVVTVVIFALASSLVGLIHGGGSIRWLASKLVLLSSALYVPVILYLWHITGV